MNVVETAPYNSYKVVVCFLLLQKDKKKNKAVSFNFSALHIIHDPQGMFSFWEIFLETFELKKKKNGYSTSKCSVNNKWFT